MKIRTQLSLKSTKKDGVNLNPIQKDFSIIIILIKPLLVLANIIVKEQDQSHKAKT